MIIYIYKRITLAILTMIAISLVTFFVIHAPAGDYVDYLHQYCSTIQCPYAVETEEEMEIIRNELGINKPMLVQYWDWITPIVFKFDFGMSARGNKGIWAPARLILAEMIPPTLCLAVPYFLLALVVMYLLYAYFDYSVGALFSGKYQLAPWSVGRVIDMISHLTVPALVLGTAGTAALIRIMRNNLLDELSKPYVITAMAKGLSPWKVVLKYPLRVAINPFVSSIGFILPSLISGSIILSIVMGLPTIGPVLLGALEFEDIYLAGDIILILGFLTVVGTLISDILLMIIDPRIKLDG